MASQRKHERKEAVWSLLVLVTGVLVGCSSTHAALPLPVHRRRECAFATLWDEQLATVTSVEALDAQKWTVFERSDCDRSSSASSSTLLAAQEPCWRRADAQVVDGVLVLGARGGGAAKVQTTRSVASGWGGGVNRVQATVKLPEVCECVYWLCVCVLALWIEPRVLRAHRATTRWKRP